MRGRPHCRLGPSLTPPGPPAAQHPSTMASTCTDGSMGASWGPSGRLLVIAVPLPALGRPLAEALRCWDRNLPLRILCAQQGPPPLFGGDRAEEATWFRRRKGRMQAAPPGAPSRAAVTPSSRCCCACEPRAPSEPLTAAPGGRKTIRPVYGQATQGSSGQTRQFAPGGPRPRGAAEPTCGSHGASLRPVGLEQGPRAEAAAGSTSQMVQSAGPAAEAAPALLAPRGAGPPGPGSPHPGRGGCYSGSSQAPA